MVEHGDQVAQVAAQAVKVPDDERTLPYKQILMLLVYLAASNFG